MAEHVYLVKESEELISHCHCDDGLIASPGQMDCPWCGCGWLFGCIGCRKAFTFARGVMTDRPWEELARQDYAGIGLGAPSPDEVDGWVSRMKGLLAGIEPGRRYVYLDGSFIPADAGPVFFEGWYARHDLPLMPQTAALANPELVNQLLWSRSYWTSRSVPRHHRERAWYASQR